MQKEKPSQKDPSVKGSFNNAAARQEDHATIGGTYFQDMADKSKAGGFEKFKNQQLSK